MSERTCGVCGRNIEEKRPQAHFCGSACRAEASRLAAGKQPRGNSCDARCAECGGPIGGGRRDRRYCGTRCKRAAAKRRVASAASADATSGLRRTSPNGTAPSGPATAPKTSSRPMPACPYRGHRFSDWLSIGGRTICGVCHPPASEHVVARWLHDHQEAA